MQGLTIVVHAGWKMEASGVELRFLAKTEGEKMLVGCHMIGRLKEVVKCLQIKEALTIM